MVHIRAGAPCLETIAPAVIAALIRTEDDLHQGALLTVAPGCAPTRLLPLPGSG